MRSPWFRLRSGGFALPRGNGFVRTLRVLLNMDCTGVEPLEIPAEVCERVATQYQQHDQERVPAKGMAYPWHRNRIDPGFRTQGTVARRPLPWRHGRQRPS